MASPPPKVLAELYAVAPRSFTAERDAKAAALARAGHADEARAVKQLRRPSPSLWATNQLARIEPEGLAAFLEAVGRIRATQFRDPAAAAEAVRQQRTHLAALVRRAGQVLSGEGHPPTPALERRISDTLLGAAVDRALADDLRHGRLAAEVPAPGFEALTGAPGGGRLRVLPGGKTPPASAGAARPVEAARRAATQAEERRRREDEARAAEATRRKAVAGELEREAAAREAAARQLAREVEAAAAALAEKRRDLREARGHARRAAAAAQKARRAARP